MIGLWERSVRATHDFLQPEHLPIIKTFLQDFDFTAVSTFCLMDNDTMLGFISLDNDKINMLFIEPNHIGKGYGRMLMDFVLDKFIINFVDVNEQNPLAKTFYEKYGFAVFNRIDKDDLAIHYCKCNVIKLFINIMLHTLRLHLRNWQDTDKPLFTNYIYLL